MPRMHANHHDHYDQRLQTIHSTNGRAVPSLLSNSQHILQVPRHRNMIKLLLLASLGLLATASKPKRREVFDCGTDTAHASEDFLIAVSPLHSGQNTISPAARAGTLAARDKDNNSAIAVDAVFHVVANENKKGDITPEMPQAQADVLSEAFKPYNIQFNLINVTWNTNNAWATGGDSELEMKKALRQGTYRTLNIYFQTDLNGNLGHCTLPSNIANGKTDPSVYVNDGCNVNANTMPGGDKEGFNTGKTAVHETGHWFGLLHTFEGKSCDGPGDFIDDTPQESQATDGCPESPPKQSCPNQSGPDKNDPIHNYMDYSYDECYTGFTPLQHDRMHHMYNIYRNGN